MYGQVGMIKSEQGRACLRVRFCGKEDKTKENPDYFHVPVSIGIKTTTLIQGYKTTPAEPAKSCDERVKMRCNTKTLLEKKQADAVLQGFVGLLICMIHDFAPLSRCGWWKRWLLS